MTGARPAAARARTLDELSRRRVLVDVHEHLGSTTLLHDNGFVSTYEQDLEGFERLASSLDWSELLRGTEILASVFFPMPLYLRFLEAEAADRARALQDVYRDKNRALVQICRRRQSAALAGGAGRVTVLPLPFLFVDPRRPASAFEEHYAAELEASFGLKWHPFAQGAPPRTFVAQGYLDLAARLGLPTVIHCARPGVEGDLDELMRVVVPAAERAGAILDIAHAGFLSPRLSDCTQSGCVYIDCAPWSVVCDFGAPGGTRAERVDRLRRIIEGAPDAVLFGLDSPWNVMPWPDGRELGAAMPLDFELWSEALRMSGGDAATRVFRENGLRFLTARPREVH